MYGSNRTYFFDGNSRESSRLWKEPREINSVVSLEKMVDIQYELSIYESAKPVMYRSVEGNPAGVDTRKQCEREWMAKARGYGMMGIDVMDRAGCVAGSAGERYNGGRYAESAGLRKASGCSVDWYVGGSYMRGHVSSSHGGGLYTGNGLINYGTGGVVIRREYVFECAPMIRRGCEGKFVGKTEEIFNLAKEAFWELFELDFPNHINVAVLEKEDFAKMAQGQGIVGLSINKSCLGAISEIFVLAGPLARVMLTLGHEIGHVLSPALSSEIDEEAKAYAFSMVWMEAIQRKDIGGLRGAFVAERPARNGVHDAAYGHVLKLIEKGWGIWKIYLGMIRREITTAGVYG